jgi:hypothetical protein
VVEAEVLSVDEAEIDAALERLVGAVSGSSDAVRRALESPAGRRRIRLDLLTDKSVARLVQIARGEAPPPASTAAGEHRSAEPAAPLGAAAASQGEASA